MDTGQRYPQEMHAVTADGHPRREQCASPALTLALDAAQIGVWECDPTSGEVLCDARMRALWELPADEPVTFEQFCAGVHRDDRERVRAAIVETANRRSGAHRRLEYRVIGMSGHVDRWIATDGCTCVDTGRVAHVVGTARDISSRKVSELHQTLIRRELEHRIRNIFAVVSAIVGLSARSARTPDQLVAMTHQRLRALQRAHTLLIDSSVPPSLADVLEAQIAPLAISPGRVTLTGPEVQLGAEPALAMSLIAHELVTNALKHGTLALPEGGLHIRWSIDTRKGSLELRWKEIGSRPSGSAPKRGFGSQLLSLCARIDLGGEITFEYASDGLTVSISVPVARLGA